MILFMKPTEIVDRKQFVVDAVHSPFEKLKTIKMKIDLKEKKWSVKISVDGKKVFNRQGSSNHGTKLDLQVKFVQGFFCMQKNVYITKSFSPCLAFTFICLESL